MEEVSVSIGDVQESDLKDLFVWINDKELMSLVDNFTPVTWESHINWFQSLPLRKDERYFVIKYDGVNVGTCKIYNINRTDLNGEVAIKIGNRAYRGRGIGSKVIEALIKKAFSELELVRLFAYIVVSNELSIRAFEKAGFIKEGELQKAKRINEEWHNMYLYSITNGDKS